MFKWFSRKWAFIYVTILLGNSQVNGDVEAAVKIVRILWRKCKAHLNLRNWLTEGLTKLSTETLWQAHNINDHSETRITFRRHYLYSAEEALKKQEKKLKWQNTSMEMKSYKLGNNFYVQPWKSRVKRQLQNNWLAIYIKYRLKMAISIDATDDSCIKPFTPCTHFQNSNGQHQKLFGSNYV